MLATVAKALITVARLHLNYLYKVTHQKNKQSSKTCKVKTLKTNIFTQNNTKVVVTNIKRILEKLFIT